MRTYIVAMALSLVVSVILTPYIRNLAIRSGWIDAPSGGRKIHKKPIPRVGGIAILIAMSVPLFGMYLWDNNISLEFREDIPLLKSLVFGSLIIGTIGILDDLFNIRARYKLFGQLAAALVVFFLGLQIESINLPFLGIIHFPYFIAMGVTVFWVTLVINAINLIDGMDGLAGSVVVLAGLSLFVMSFMEENLLAALLLISFVGATIGFLVYNLNPASVFLGDTGSMLLGFILSLTAVHSSQKSYTIFSMLASIMILGLPIFDLLMAVVRRFLSGKPIFGADQYHIHHILLRKGFTQKQSVLLLFTFAFALESLAFLSIYADDRLAALSILAIVPIGAVAMKFLGYGTIISQSRKTRLLEQINLQANDQLTWVEGWISRPHRSFQECLSDLPELSAQLSWLSVVLYRDQEAVYQWPSNARDEHIQDKVINRYTLKEGLYLEFHQLQEKEIFSAFSKSIQLMVVQKLLQLSYKEEPHQYQLL